MRGLITPDDAINWDYGPTRGLAGLWMNLPGQGRGNKFRDLTRKNDGTFNNGPTWASWNGFGAVNFASASSQAVLLGTSLAQSGDFSVAAWGRSDTASGTRQLFSRGELSGSFDQNWLLFQRDSAGVTWSFQVRSGGADNECRGTSSVVAGQWAFVVGTYLSGTPPTMKLYVDGDLETTDSSGVAASSSATLTTAIGSYLGGADFFNGPIPFVAIWSGRVLSSADVSDLYYEGLRGFPNLLNWRRPRRNSTQEAVAGFKAAWAAQSTKLINAGVG